MIVPLPKYRFFHNQTQKIYDVNALRLVHPHGFEPTVICQSQGKAEHSFRILDGELLPYIAKDVAGNDVYLYDVIEHVTTTHCFGTPTATITVETTVVDSVDKDYIENVIKQEDLIVVSRKIGNILANPELTDIPEQNIFVDSRYNVFGKYQSAWWKHPDYKQYF
ncbi:hypothetical protein JXA27_06765 [Aerococcaceae bacterium zg-B36]|uniref:hypothetical protein n=1 Tax=Aerococcaceae bacterium zg-252 TaxID=2796928 RepID=UPI001BD902CC|nr:hypothetical protein [Aerococcaceae bacterium zg-B36]